MLLIKKFKKKNQYSISLLLILLVAITCFVFSKFIHYRVVSLILLMTVSLIAMVFEILPVLCSALISALVWNFFFIPPVFTFEIHEPEDVLMFVLYFFIASINAVLTLKIRAIEKKAIEKDEQEKTIKLYNTLFNSLSHELKTPITTIIGSVDTLKEQNLNKEQTNELLNQIEIAGNRLNIQVVNLLNMSRLETGLLQPKLEWCDVNELINLVIQKTEYSKKIVFFKPNENLPICKLDSGLMEQVLINIVSNAVLYTPIHATITISTCVENELLQIEISDNGNGVSDENLQQLFNKFYRVQHTNISGSGLGLSIAKGFVEAHNGTITAQHNTPHGLTIIIAIKVETTYVNSLKHE